MFLGVSDAGGVTVVLTGRGSLNALMVLVLLFGVGGISGDELDLLLDCLGGIGFGSSFSVSVKEVSITLATS